MRRRAWWLLGKAAFLLIGLGGCGGGGGGENPFRGEEKIAVDVSLRPAVEPVVEMFSRTYPQLGSGCLTYRRSGDSGTARR